MFSIDSIPEKLFVELVRFFQKCHVTRMLIDLPSTFNAIKLKTENKY